MKNSMRNRTEHRMGEAAVTSQYSLSRSR